MAVAFHIVGAAFLGASALVLNGLLRRGNLSARCKIVLEFANPMLVGSTIGWFMHVGEAALDKCMFGAFGAALSWAAVTNMISNSVVAAVHGVLERGYKPKVVDEPVQSEKPVKLEAQQP